MLQPRRRPNRPAKTAEELAKNAGITLYPAEIAELDRLQDTLRLRSRGDVIRELMKAAPAIEKAPVTA